MNLVMEPHFRASTYTEFLFTDLALYRSVYPLFCFTARGG
ncbi:hypothetical protein PF003_g38414 [Phytophthora fragariae]|nr:hypothetical protein PF003_g38414 [Phytophthora fragariae]